MMTCRSKAAQPDWGAIAGAIRQSVPALDAARQFGLNVNEHGFARCPFHGDKTPSLKVYSGSRGYYCFACKASGSVIDLVGKLCGTGPRDTMRLIDSAFGLGLADSDTRELTKKREAFRAKQEEKRERVRKAEQAHEKAVQNELDARMAAKAAAKNVRLTYDEEGQPVIIGDDSALFAALNDMARAQVRTDAAQEALFEQYAQLRRDAP